jgi:HlyD family secretion protein
MRIVPRVALGALAIASCVAGVAAWPVTRFDTATSEVTLGPITASMVASGTLQAPTTIDVGTPLSGIVDALEVDEGAVVRAGDILARIDPAPYEARLRVARDALAAARIDAAATAGAIDAADRDVRSAAADLEHTIIRSPVDGIVVVRNVNVGELLTSAPQAPVVYRVGIDLDRLQLLVNARPADLPDVHQGDVATFTVDGDRARTFRATVSKVSHTIVAAVANPDGRLRPGMPVTITFAEATRDDAIRIPAEALAFEPPPEARAIVDDDGLTVSAEGDPVEEGVRQVWRYERGRLTPVAVRLGLSGPEWTEMVSGALQPGDELATGVVARRGSRLGTTWFP